jgi:small-conductance mechanosensitive channel
VIAALVDAAASVSGVLGRPAPVALFQGFGESALNFELRAWTDRFDDWGAIRSRIAVAVNERFKSEGIAMPFPQRDVTLRFPSREGA